MVQRQTDKKWWHLTPYKTNIVPETEWLEDVIFFGGGGCFCEVACYWISMFCHLFCLFKRPGWLGFLFEPSAAQ